SAGLHVVFGGSGVLDSVEEKDILLRAIALVGEIVGGGGIGDAGAAGFLGGEVDYARIEGQEEVEAAAVEGQIFDLPLADQAGNVAGGGDDKRSIGGDIDLGFDCADLQREINSGFLADGEMDAGANFV